MIKTMTTEQINTAINNNKKLSEMKEQLEEIYKLIESDSKIIGRIAISQMKTLARIQGQKIPSHSELNVYFDFEAKTFSTVGFDYDFQNMPISMLLSEEYIKNALEDVKRKEEEEKQKNLKQFEKNQKLKERQKIEKRVEEKLKKIRKKLMKMEGL